MTDLINLLVMGIVAGLIAGLWTRIIKKRMIFARIGAFLKEIDNDSWIARSRHSQIIKFFNCMFCLVPWLCIILDVVYILTYTPEWIFAIIGVLGSFGSGNLIAEIIHCLRNEDL